MAVSGVIAVEDPLLTLAFPPELLPEVEVGWSGPMDEEPLETGPATGAAKPFDAEALDEEDVLGLAQPVAEVDGELAELDRDGRLG